MMVEAATPRPRYALIDMGRGIALIAMVIYHAFWDLSYLRFFSVDVSADLGWVIFARTILASFLFLVGVGLVLSHGKAIRWRTFWKRLAILVAAAALITFATVMVFPDAFVYFGILHAIALFSLMALPFLRAPLWLVVVVALVIMALGWGYSDPFFNERAFSWLGFWTIPPLTNDLVPIFPWFGVVLGAIVTTRLLIASGRMATLDVVKASNPPKRALAKLGRWTLVIYLVHQPLLLGALYPLSLVLRPGAEFQQQQFLSQCQSTCLAGGTGPDQCTTYCQCGLTGVIDNDLWDGVNSGRPTPSEQAALNTITQACSALIYPVAPK
ncbi:heparan-alpha-glucosaminide N-acetyltransferase [Devosia rhodophyticola]|uniref:Heparan-alpha-glucosaminide N-acetyltransferase n=1 Tax=Devosia rhodophyticola TaxID=3026423 RepID=A0ABY7YZL0_9HYPH|nr:heparan-alpha-glucosaminide N-acetyltransferase [Devosia rhodophyticola]WDR06801.1 heparan-alpha-glucosaminide N-acetyltransferase [Devosia rhodophyticola]